jgi:hypothetical protein
MTVRLVTATVRLVVTATLAMRLGGVRAFTASSSSVVGGPGLQHFLTRRRCSPASTTMVLDESPATPPKARPNAKAPVHKLEGKLLKGEFANSAARRAPHTATSTINTMTSI